MGLDTYLNIVFLMLFAVLFWASRHRDRLGGGPGYAIDPVCGMQVETANAPASTHYQGLPIFFCSEPCRDRFEKAPQRFAGVAGSEVAT